MNLAKFQNTKLIHRNHLHFYILTMKNEIRNQSDFTEVEQKNFTIHMEIQKTPNSQSSLEKEEWSWRNQPSWVQIILQSYIHKDSMVLAQKQKYSSREQDRRPRNKPIHLWVPYFWHKRQAYTMEQSQPLQLMVLGKLDNYM